LPERCGLYGDLQMRIQNYQGGNPMLRRKIAAIFSACLVLAAMTVAQSKSISGKWKAQGNREGQTIIIDFDFKVSGENLTGTASRAQFNQVLQIQNGKIRGNQISFDTGDVGFNFAGTIEGDQLKIRMSGGTQDPTDLVAKRVN
jgi:hypothetical protein